ncbi:MAG: redoxin domain-containing protein [Caldisericaceae bacterium]
MAIRVGENVQDFTLKDQNDEEFTLSRFRGKRVLLSFHPLAWTGVCAKQMQSLEENFETFVQLNTVPVGISVDTVPSKKAWGDSLGIRNLRMLSDFWPHGALASLLDVFMEKFGFSERANIIVDGKGKVIFVKVYPVREVPPIEEVLDFLREH